LPERGLGVMVCPAALPRPGLAFYAGGVETLTFLFTDIEGSTALLGRLGEEVYARVLAGHHAIIGSGLAAHGGREVDTQGDAFFAVFGSPAACVAAVIQMQQALQDYAWPAGECVRVRMGVHTGEASRTATGLVGLDVHRAARVAAAGYGGQVLVSQASAALLGNGLPPEVALVDLGVHRLKDLEDPVRIFQLRAAGLQAEFPPLRTVPGGAAAATRTLPRDLTSFTGRRRELAELAEAAAGTGGVVGIHAIGGMAGVGKTAFAVHAAYRLAPRFPAGQIFLPLHGHTPGHQPVDPADALASLLLTAGVPAAQVPPGLEARMALWRDRLAGQQLLLILDDAADSEQVRPLLPGAGGSLVLITSRRHLSALEDATAISLDTLPPDEAASLLARLVSRTRLSPDDAAVAEITRLCGYLPLAIGMLAGRLRHHPAWTAAGMAADLAAAQDRLAEMHAENLSVAAAFDLSYADLTPGQQRLFRRLGLVPGPSIDAHAAAALDGTSLAAARRGLDELYDQHLLTEPAPGRYVLHDLVREHARALAAADDPQARAATDRLLDYYLHTALAAGRNLPFWDPTCDDAAEAASAARPPACAPPVSTAGQAAAWLDAERANLQAAAQYAAASGRLAHAMLIPAAMAGFLQAEGRWDQAVAVHVTAVAAARQAGDQRGQARALLGLAVPRFRTGDRTGAVAAAQQALALYRDLGDRTGQADAVSFLGFMHRLAGDYQAAAACHQQALELCRGLGDGPGQAGALIDLSAVQQETGDYRAAAASARQAVQLLVDLGDRHGQILALANLGDVQRLTGDHPAATASVQQAQALSDELGHRYFQAWLPNQLGVLHRLAGDYQAAAACHQQALQALREVGEPAAQGYARNDLGLVQQETGDYPAAAASHQQALRLMRDADEPYGQAYVLNSLGELATRTSATGQARDHHGQALAIARQIGAPLEQARALEGTGRSHLRDGHHDQAIAFLRQALAIYQRIGAPAARRVRDTLASHGRLTGQDDNAGD
jgi:class 3 adenylate cyclase/tetratricopeptide (TPR) repeat protein